MPAGREGSPISPAPAAAPGRPGAIQYDGGLLARGLWLGLWFLGLRPLRRRLLRQPRRLELRDPVDGHLLIAPVAGGRDMRLVGLRCLMRRLLGPWRRRPGLLAGVGFARLHAAVYSG